MEREGRGVKEREKAGGIKKREGSKPKRGRESMGGEKRKEEGRMEEGEGGGKKGMHSCSSKSFKEMRNQLKLKSNTRIIKRSG